MLALVTVGGGAGGWRADAAPHTEILTLARAAAAERPATTSRTGAVEGQHWRSADQWQLSSDTTTVTHTWTVTRDM